MTVWLVGISSIADCVKLSEVLMPVAVKSTSLIHVASGSGVQLLCLAVIADDRGTSSSNDTNINNEKRFLTPACSLICPTIVVHLAYARWAL